MCDILALQWSYGMSWLDSLRIKACDFFHTTPAGVPIAAESSMLNRQLGTLIRVVNRFFNAMVLNGFLIVEVRSASNIWGWGEQWELFPHRKGGGEQVTQFHLDLNSSVGFFLTRWHDFQVTSWKKQCYAMFFLFKPFCFPYSHSTKTKKYG